MMSHSMKSRERLVRRSCWILLLWVLISGCSRSRVGIVPALAPEMVDSEEPLRSIALLGVMILEFGGIAVILLGAAVATGNFLYRISQESFSIARYHRYRENLGEVILLGLEFLVAADIVGTVALSLRIENVLSLTAIILVRTFLSFTLEVETTGYWPWQRSGQTRTGIRETLDRTTRDQTQRQEDEDQT